MFRVSGATLSSAPQATRGTRSRTGRMPPSYGPNRRGRRSSRAIRVLAVAVFAIAAFVATSGPAPVAALAVGDFWTYAYHQAGASEWNGIFTETYVGVVPGNLLGIQVDAGGTISGDATGTWSLDQFSAYRGTDGAFVNASSVLDYQYVQFGDSFHVVDMSETSNNPPLDLGGSLQVGAVTSGTTNQTTTRTLIVNGNTSGPTTTPTVVTITRTIVARVQVTVPAGTFTAWRIRYTSSDSAEFVEHAFNETVGSDVRIQVFDASANVAASLELQAWSYHPGGPQGTPVGLATSIVPYAAVGATAAVVVAIVWWDRRRRPTGGVSGPQVPLAPPPSQPPP